MRQSTRQHPSFAADRSVAASCIGNGSEERHRVRCRKCRITLLAKGPVTQIGNTARNLDGPCCLLTSHPSDGLGTAVIELCGGSHENEVIFAASACSLQARVLESRGFFVTHSSKHV